MAAIYSKPVLGLSLVIHVNEKEARALEAMVSYGTEEFLKAFYEKLGHHYMQKHADALRTLFACLRKDIPPELSKFDSVKALYEGTP